MWINPEDYKIVGAALADARKAAGISQDQLAAVLAKPQSFVSLYEQGQRRIDLLEFLRIAEALNVDPNKVFANIAARHRPSRG